MGHPYRERHAEVASTTTDKTPGTAKTQTVKKSTQTAKQTKRSSK